VAGATKTERPRTNSFQKATGGMLSEHPFIEFECSVSYKIVYSGFLNRGKNTCKLLILLVGERGFEPPTPWSRTRFRGLLKSVEIA
jgi:hypothetical protein